MPSRTTWNILIPTLAASGLLLSIGLGGAWYVHLANRQVSETLVQELAAAHASERVVLALRELRLDLGRFAEALEAADLASAEAWVDALRSDYPASVAAVGNMGPGRPQGLDELRRQLQRLRQEQDAAVQRNLAREWIGVLNQDLLPDAEQRLAAWRRATTETSRRNQLIADRIGVGLLTLGVCGSIAGLLFGFGVARGVHRSLVRIRIPVQDMAGRLNDVVGPILVEGDQEFAALDASLKILAEKTADVVQRLQESQRKSIRQEQLAAVGQLAAGLAHELRNPLMSVKLILQTAAERSGAALTARDLSVLEDEVTRLERMLQTFLDFARPPRPEKREVELRRLVETTLEVVRLRASQQGVSLHFDADGAGAVVEADESQLRRLLLNLLLNALDALPGGGNVWLDLQRGPSPDWATIRVSDDGPGFPEDAGERIFEPFVSTKDTGIGLGLSICRQIVESHDGRIMAAPRPGGGAEFIVSLPRRSAATAGEKAPLVASRS